MYCTTVMCPYTWDFAWRMLFIRCQVLDNGIMCNFSCLWESIYILGYLCEYVYIVQLSLIFYFYNNYFGIMDICIIMISALFTRITRLEYLTSMYMYIILMLKMLMFTCSLIVVKSDMGVLNSPWYSMRFTPAVTFALWVSIFLVWCHVLLMHRLI